MTPVVRPVRPGDWPYLIALEAEAYRDKGLSEAPEVLRSRAGAGTCFIVDAGGTVAGYLLALPYPESRCPDLSSAESAVHESANLHLHDMVVAGRRRGGGLGRLLLNGLLAAARARAYDRVSLVSVAGSAGFWAAHGFRPHPVHDLPAGYGPGAVYLSRPVHKEI